MGDLFDILFKFGSASSGDTVRAFFRFIRFVMLGVFTSFLYRTWVSDFRIVTTVQEIVEYFMSARFLYAIIIFVFVLGCEFLGIFLISKVNKFLCVGKALKFADEIRKARAEMPEGEKLEIRKFFHDKLKTGGKSVVNWLGDDIDANELKKLIPKPKKLRPELMDVYSLFAVEVFIYMLCTGHSWLWGLLLVVILVVSAFIKFFLIIGKNVLPLLTEPKKKPPVAVTVPLIDKTTKPVG